MTTPLPSRLRESARLLRGLYLYSENLPVKLIDKADSTRIAAELTEAADALEAQREDRREVLRILYEAHRKASPSPSLAAISAAIQHLQAVEDASAQVAQEGAAGVPALPTPKLCPGCAQYHGRNDCPVGWLAPAVQQEAQKVLNAAIRELSADPGATAKEKDRG